MSVKEYRSPGQPRPAAVRAIAPPAGTVVLHPISYAGVPSWIPLPEGATITNVSINRLEAGINGRIEYRIPQTIQTVSEFSRKQLVAIGMQPDYLVTDSSARVSGKSGEKAFELLGRREGDSANSFVLNFSEGKETHIPVAGAATTVHLQGARNAVDLALKGTPETGSSFAISRNGIQIEQNAPSAGATAEQKTSTEPVHFILNSDLSTVAAFYRQQIGIPVAQSKIDADGGTLTFEETRRKRRSTSNRLAKTKRKSRFGSSRRRNERMGRIGPMRRMGR